MSELILKLRLEIENISENIISEGGGGCLLDYCSLRNTFCRAATNKQTQPWLYDSCHSNRINIYACIINIYMFLMRANINVR